MQKVLLVARVFPPFRSVGHSIRVVKFIKYLPALGWMPTVLTVDDRREYEFDRKQGSGSSLEEIPPDVVISRTLAGEPSWKYLEKETAFGRRNWLTRVIVKVVGGARRWTQRNILLPDYCIVWLPFALKRGRQIVKDQGIDVIFATCPPHSASLIGALLKLITGKRLVLDFRDDWIDTPSYESKSAVRRWIERRMEAWVVDTADQVILVTEWSKRAFQERYPEAPGGKFVFIPNGCDIVEFAAPNAAATVPRDPRFTILHAGSLNDSPSWTRRPATVFQALQAILEEQPWMADELALAFTGQLPERQAQLAADAGLSSVVKELGFLSRDDLIRSMRAADLLLVINYEGFETLVPGKIYEYWAVGGPPLLVLSCPGAATHFVEKYQLGLAADPSDVAGIKEAILIVYRRSKSTTPLRVSTAGIEMYDRRTLTRTLAQVLSKVS